MRRLIALTFAFAACSGDRQTSSSASSTSGQREADQIVLRVPRGGGTARAYVFPRLDSAVWTAGGSPGVSRILAFDGDDGLIAFIDDKGRPRRFDLRLSEVRLASGERLSSISSATGEEIYGVTAAGRVMRLTPSGDWSFKPPAPARWVFPQRNGWLVIGGNEGPHTHFWRIRPPDDEIQDSASFPLLGRGATSQVGDRLYFVHENGLVGVKTGDLSPVQRIELQTSVAAMAPTPSGDRLYIALRGMPRIAVVDRYRQTVAQTVTLPGSAIDLRMDPLGQHLLARPSSGDSVWVIPVGGAAISGTIRSVWRSDLPAFAPGGSIATIRGGDVLFVDAGSLTEGRKVSGGAKDFWYFFSWNGFRPRSADLDAPVTFGSGESATIADTVGDTLSDTVAPGPPLRDTIPSMIEPPSSLPPTRAQGKSFLVSFATLLTEEKARAVAGEIVVNGVRPHVMAARSGVNTIYRVVLGPYASRDEADRVGRDSKRQYWVLEVRE